MAKPTASLLAVAAAALLVAPGAGAALPRPKHTSEIDVPRSIAGVGLGTPIARADREWGRTGDCGRDEERKGLRICSYQGRNPRAGDATIEAARRRKVSAIGIQAGLDGDRYVFKGRLMRMRTGKGIGLGSRAARVRKAYPRAIPTADRTGYIVEGERRSYMAFQTLDRKHVTGIELVDGVGQGRAAALDSLATRP